MSNTMSSRHTADHIYSLAMRSLTGRLHLLPRGGETLEELIALCHEVIPRLEKKGYSVTVTQSQVGNYGPSALIEKKPLSRDRIVHR